MLDIPRSWISTPQKSVHWVQYPVLQPGVHAGSRITVSFEARDYSCNCHTFRPKISWVRYGRYRKMLFDIADEAQLLAEMALSTRST